jgi:hypothetical protein
MCTEVETFNYVDLVFLGCGTHCLMCVRACVRACVLACLLACARPHILCKVGRFSFSLWHKRTNEMSRSPVASLLTSTVKLSTTKFFGRHWRPAYTHNIFLYVREVLQRATFFASCLCFIYFVFNVVSSSISSLYYLIAWPIEAEHNGRAV